MGESGSSWWRVLRNFDVWYVKIFRETAFLCSLMDFDEEWRLVNIGTPQYHSEIIKTRKYGKKRRSTEAEEDLLPAGPPYGALRWPKVQRKVSPPKRKSERNLCRFSCIGDVLHTPWCSRRWSRDRWQGEEKNNITEFCVRRRTTSMCGSLISQKNLTVIWPCSTFYVTWKITLINHRL